MIMTRREFLDLGKGAAAAVALLAVPLVPGTALAVAVVDDAIIGAVVAAIAALGGYLVTSSSAPASYEAFGTGFKSFVQSQSVKAEAVRLCMEAATQYAANIQEVEAQAAAEAVAGVSGFFGDALESAATTGRLALDGVVSGATAGVGVLRSLVSLYMAQFVGSAGQTMLPGSMATTDVVTNGFSFDSLTSSNKGTVDVAGLDDLVAGVPAVDGVPAADGAVWALRQRVFNDVNALTTDYILYGYGTCTLSVDDGGRTLKVGAPASTPLWYFSVAADGTMTYQGSSTYVAIGRWPSYFKAYYTISSSMVAGNVILPGVDRAADAPDVITPGFDSVPLGQDLVIDGTTGAVTGAGTIPLPQSVPDVIGGLNDWLDGALAGVVPGTIALPVPVTTPVVVATPEGIATMPIEQARLQDTSLVEPGYVPPVTPIDPPVSVPEGPWTPAVTLPFESVWPFNMIYDVIKLFQTLGA